MNESVVVYGRQGCGKTKNKQLLQMIYGLDSVVDSWDGKLPLVEGVLALTNIEPPYSIDLDLKVVPYVNAMSFKNWLRLQEVSNGGVDLLMTFLKRDESLPDDITSHKKLMDYLVSQSADNTAWDEALTVWNRYEDWLENLGVIY